MGKIDTHQHVLLPHMFHYPWTADLPALQPAFSLDDYRAAAEGCDVEATLFMEVDVAESQSGDEARYFCRQADDPTNRIRGVLAAARPEKDGFEAYLDSIQHAQLKGIRRVLHTQPDELILNQQVQTNIRRLSRHNLTFDLCVLQRQLPLAAELVRACPDTPFILDHCGNPEMTEQSRPVWETAIRAMAAQPNVVCKISGLVTHRPENEQSAEVFRPWVETVIEGFGWDRVIWGGDWPVCTLTSSLRQWVSLLDEILMHEDAQNLQKLYTQNAERIYNLS